MCARLSIALGRWTKDLDEETSWYFAYMDEVLYLPFLLQHALKLIDSLRVQTGFSRQRRGTTPNSSRRSYRSDSRNTFVRTEMQTIMTLFATPALSPRRTISNLGKDALPTDRSLRSFSPLQLSEA